MQPKVNFLSFKSLLAKSLSLSENYLSVQNNINQSINQKHACTVPTKPNLTESRVKLTPTETRVCMLSVSVQGLLGVSSGSTIAGLLWRIQSWRIADPDQSELKC